MKIRVLAMTFATLSAPVVAQTTPGAALVEPEKLSADSGCEADDTYLSSVPDGFISDVASLPEPCPLPGVLVVAYGNAPPGSGYLHTYRKIVVRDIFSTEKVLYTTWLGGDQPMPPIGSSCDLTWHWGFASDWDNRAANIPAQAKRIMDNFICKSL